MDVGGSQMNSRDIPSEEDFARARAVMSERDRGLSDVRARLLERFRDQGLHEIFVLFSPASGTFVARLFFRTNKQVAEAAITGLAAQIESAVVDELENVGRGIRSTLKIVSEYDSHENVVANFEGDYFLRLK